MPSGKKSGQFWVHTPQGPHRPKLHENPKEIENLVATMSGVLDSQHRNRYWKNKPTIKPSKNQDLN